MIETLRHKEAFECFYLLGGKASKSNCSKVASEFHISERTFWNWYKQFGWQERVQLRDQNNAEKIAEKTDTQVVDDKARMLGIVREAITEFKKNLSQKIVQVMTISDLEKLVKLALLLQGENTDSTAINLAGYTKEELMKLAGIND